MHDTPSTIYESVHNWLRANYGKADKCENPICKTESKKYQWAKIRDKAYDFERNNFFMLCVKCHKQYDMSNQLISMERKICKEFAFIRRKLFLMKDEFCSILGIDKTNLINIEASKRCPTLNELILLKKYLDQINFKYDSSDFSTYFQYLDYKDN